MEYKLSKDYDRISSMISAANQMIGWGSISPEEYKSLPNDLVEACLSAQASAHNLISKLQSYRESQEEV